MTTMKSSIHQFKTTRLCDELMYIMLEKTEGAIIKLTVRRNWQHWVHTTQDEDKKTHTPLCKQLEVKTNRISFVCGNCSEHHNM